MNGAASNIEIAQQASFKQITRIAQEGLGIADEISSLWPFQGNTLENWMPAPTRCLLRLRIAD
jgi:hypothetical protein